MCVYIPNVEQRCIRSTSQACGTRWWYDPGILLYGNSKRNSGSFVGGYEVEVIVLLYAMCDVITPMVWYDDGTS